MLSQDILNAQTVVQLFQIRSKESANDVAYEYESDGQWHAVTWSSYADSVRSFALGLRSLGFGFGERLSIWGETTPEWTIADLGVMALGGCSAGIYQTNTPEQAAYIINDSDSKVVVVDSEERLKQALSIHGDTPNVRAYITWEAAGDHSNDIYSFDDVVSIGQKYDLEHPNEYDEIVENIKPDTTAVLVYTSGTTGPPKGAMLSHKNCLFCSHGMHERLDIVPPQSAMSFLPLSHVAEHVVGFVNRIFVGTKAYFLTDLNRLTEVAQAKQPSVMGAVPRLYEKIYAGVMEKVSTAPPNKQKLFHWAVSKGHDAAQYRMADKPIPLAVNLKFKIADKLVLSKIRGVLGGKIKVMVCGAAPLAPEIIEFFNALNLPFIEVYGMTESSGISHMNGIGKYKAGSVGTVMDGYECRLAEDGEILVRGDGVFQGYLNRPEATAEALDDEGWLHTGDIGEEDQNGFLKITDRKKNLIITAGGKNVAPANIELLINREPIISQVVVIGDQRRFLSALITVSDEEIEKLKQHEVHSGKTSDEIRNSDVILDRVHEAVTSANSELARYENIRKYEIMEREFSVDDGEMTPTLKLKRKIILEKHATLIEEFYLDD
jgi:long-chain acyl-CoA synthetase